jgi:hypothetical protein
MFGLAGNDGAGSGEISAIGEKLREMRGVPGGPSLTRGENLRALLVQPVLRYITQENAEGQRPNGD